MTLSTGVSNLKPGCHCRLHFSWQNHSFIYMVALERDPSVTYICKDGTIYMYNIAYTTLCVVRFSVV